MNPSTDEKNPNVHKKSILKGNEEIDDSSLPLGCLNLCNSVSDNNDSKAKYVSKFASSPSQAKIATDAEEYAEKLRKEIGLLSYQKLLMAVAFITNVDMIKFMKYPEALFMNTTFDTNNEERPLLTICGKDCFGKTYVFLRALLPNERAFSFHWLLFSFLPAHVPKKYLNRVQMLLTDGDPQEYTQIDYAVQDGILENTFRGRCSWHIINRGMNALSMSHVWAKTDDIDPPYEEKRVSREFSIYYNEINDWCFSFATPRCETKNEFEISLSLLKDHIKSYQKILGSKIIEQTLQWLNEKVVPNQLTFCFYNRISVLHFDNHSNGTSEAHHHHIKNSKCKVGPHPNNFPVETCKKLVDMSNESDFQYNIRVTKEVHTKLLWSFTDTSNKISSFAEGISKEEIECAKCMIDYVCYDNTTFYTRYQRDYINPDDNFDHCNPIPRFDRIRKVSIDQNNILHCTCKMVERFQIPCRHIITVNGLHVSLEDIGVRWYLSYAREFCSSQFPDKQDYYEKKLGSYMGPVYRNQNMKKNDYPIYHCDDKRNENMNYFQNGNINQIKIWNYQHVENGNYASIPLPDENIVETNDDYVGYSQESSGCVNFVINEKKRLRNSNMNDKKSMLGTICFLYSKKLLVKLEMTRIFLI